MLTAADFRSVFDQVDAKSPSEHCLLLARFNQRPTPRLGFIISKKNIRLAVQRNRIKRLTRDYFRLHQTDFNNLDIIFMARKGLDKLNNEDLKILLQKQFNKLIQRATRQTRH